MGEKFKLTKQDEEVISALAAYIYEKAQTLTLRSLFTGDKLKNFIRDHTGYQMNMKKRIKGEGYTFLSENEVDIALNLFFANEYNCKRIAKSIYIMEEGDYLIETLDMEIPIGECTLPNKAIYTSSVFEVIMKVRPYRNYNIQLDEEEEEAEIEVLAKQEEEFKFPYSINPKTKLPFDIAKIAVIPE